MFCLADFNREEEGTEFLFSSLSVGSCQQFAPSEPLHYLCRCKTLHSQPGRASWEGAGEALGLQMFVGAQGRSKHPGLPRGLQMGLSCAAFFHFSQPSYLHSPSFRDGVCSPGVPQHLSSFRAWEQLEVNQSRRCSALHAYQVRCFLKNCGSCTQC